MLGALIGGARDDSRPRGRKWLGALAATALMSTVLVVAATPSAAATTKSLTATCTGADAATSGALAAFGGSVAAPVTVTTEAPPFVEPGQTGIPVTVKWALSLDAATVNLVAAISPSLVVSVPTDPSQPGLDAVVSGPTSTTVITGRPSAQTINLVPNQPFRAELPPFTGELNDISGGGIIKVSTQNISFSIQLTQGPLTDPLNLTCSTGATLASIPVKVAGSPNIVQPIDLEVGAGEEVTLDVLADYVTNGTTKDGTEQQVDPSTLKVVDGPGAIVDGRLVATAPAAGSSADVTFEVCAGTVEIAPADPGTTEVQELRIFEDVPNIAGKRQMGARFNFAGEAAADVLWSAAPLVGLPGQTWTPGLDFSNNEAAYPNWWVDNVNTFALFQSRFRAPSGAEVQAALESIPSIGPGNVKVTQGARRSAGDATQPGLAYHPYTVEFSGALANRALDQIGTAKLYSFFPQEIKAGLLALAGGAGGGGGGAPTAPIPPGTTALEYVNQLNAEAGYYLSIGKLLDGADGSPGYVSTVELLLTVVGENIGSLIDVQAATALLNRIFQPTPEVVTITQGEDPTEAQTQDLCSQGLVTLSVPGADDTPPAPPPGDGNGDGGSGGSGSGDGSGTGTGTSSGTGSGSGSTGAARLAFTG